MSSTSRPPVSPLRAKPLRQAGAGVGNMLRREQVRVLERFVTEQWLLAAGVGLAVGTALPRHGAISWFGVAVAVFALIRMWRTSKLADTFDFLRMGQEGEVAVAEALAVLERRHGARVFHDVETGKGRIDHVIVHASGVYAVETKTMSRHNDAYDRLRFDGEKIWNGKFECLEQAPRQALRQAVGLRDFVRDQAGILLRTRAVLLLPGWDLERDGTSSTLWVDSPQGFVSGFEADGTCLSPETERQVVQALIRQQRGFVDQQVG